MKVYQAINKVQAALAKEGITKSMRNNQGAGYNFRGIDQVYNALSPLLAEHGLCILPRVVKSEQTERQSAKGGLLIYSYVTMEFDLVSAEDGTKHTICTVGEAFDSGDKSMNKAMSAAYKYAAFQTFAIPTEGDNDADAQTHTPAPKIPAMKGLGDDLPIEKKQLIDSIAFCAIEKFEKDDLIGAYEECEGINEIDTGNDEKLYFWKQLPSKMRTAITKHKETLKGEK